MISAGDLFALYQKGSTIAILAGLVKKKGMTNTEARDLVYQMLLEGQKETAAIKATVPLQIREK